MSFRETVRTDRFKFILAFVLIAILAVSLIGVAIKLNKSITKRTVSPSEYSCCVLNDSTGVQGESNGAIVTGYVSCDGLKCEIKNDADITYKVFFYTENKTFVSATGALSADYSTVPDTAKYCRIQITPLTDTNISYVEIYTYASQLNVTVNK